MFPRKEDPVGMLLAAMVGGSSDGLIEAQEKRGQQALVNSDVLPKKINTGTRQQFEAMGIIFGEDADDIFVYVTLPDGWKKVPTGHDMWSHLIDDKGRKRAAIFYKAAFYDRSAHVSISRRYSVSSYESTDEKGNPMSYDAANHFSVCVTDCDVSFRVFSTRAKNDRNAEKDEQRAFDWLKENYPDYQNPLAYWS